MLRRMMIVLVFGLAGAGVLASLGVWQLQRLAWKEGVLAEIAVRITAPPVALPASPDPVADRYLPVTVTGRFTGPVIEVLVSRKEIGAGVRIIAAFEAEDGRRLLIDRGFVRDAARGLPREAVAATVTGNLLWPNEVDGFTPAPDAKTGLWFARDLPAIAVALDSLPVLVVARSDTGDGIEPLPIDGTNVPNNHFGYAVQWFLMAAVWLGMTLLYLRRIRLRTD